MTATALRTHCTACGERLTYEASTATWTPETRWTTECTHVPHASVQVVAEYKSRRSAKSFVEREAEYFTGEDFAPPAGTRTVDLIQVAWERVATTTLHLAGRKGAFVVLALRVPVSQPQEDGTCGEWLERLWRDEDIAMADPALLGIRRCQRTFGHDGFHSARTEADIRSITRPRV